MLFLYFSLDRVFINVTIPLYLILGINMNLEKLSQKNFEYLVIFTAFLLILLGSLK